MDDGRRAVPPTHQVLADPRLAAAALRLGVGILKDVVRDAVARCRNGELTPDQVVEAALAALPATASSLHRVLNATGVVVHTNLGRAPLSEAAMVAVREASGATDVEFDLDTGQRAARGRGALQALAAAVPAAEAVHVVNNGAAALALVTAALAAGAEVVVARGEMVEIGDGFRIPELLESVGARLREVGTTNRVRLDDYAAAVSPATGFILKVHPSNFVVRGFTASVDVAALSGLAVPVVADIGSGLLTPHPRLPDEPDAATVLHDGAAVVTASGDKLLGGPQCGLLLGRADAVARARRHPLARALRTDKLTLAALEATLRGPRPPVGSALAADLGGVRRRAAGLADELRGAGLDAYAVETKAVVGGGGAPGVELPSAAVSLPASLAPRLRMGSPAVVGRICDQRLLLDLIAVPPEEDDAIAEAVRAAAKD